MTAIYKLAKCYTQTNMDDKAYLPPTEQLKVGLSRYFQTVEQHRDAFAALNLPLARIGGLVSGRRSGQRIGR